MSCLVIGAFCGLQPRRESSNILIELPQARRDLLFAPATNVEAKPGRDDVAVDGIHARRVPMRRA